MDFTPFTKIARLSRDCIITEKIDGTNASICITPEGAFLVGSRSRWITPTDDNYGFATWAFAHKDELMLLGVGHHFGEWWGQGIQRKYGLTEKRFSLFNTSRWNASTAPTCCHVVPVLYSGIFSTGAVEATMTSLRESGSIASPGFMKPEGVVIFHIAAQTYFKKTFEKDEEGKHG